MSTTACCFAGAGSTALHYAACGGNPQCCQILITRGANLTAENANGWTPSMVARSWHRNELEEILGTQPGNRSQICPSSYLSIPFMSIVKIARECGWRNKDSLPTCEDACVVCLERKCTVAAEGLCFWIHPKWWYELDAQFLGFVMSDG
ncbi:E3 UBIQUITIN-PROTEIN LIGASE XBOS32 ISOFORM X1-RELATED [Salix koriyanagi]|uniref:E3 UBIQUITIN-PROTEIN LIGASE XBOS32 ISOFORM X1-RELATED n=1 Tax=Salix koriyanagi TaxID=2511006 RepID=A0A9Q0W229_9ROSI|nr:E3 UBIQUITIN-PROTEIN LIGASE XBOS32 ISOFORM X1-RELATED [Salix koriyanagi]